MMRCVTLLCVFGLAVYASAAVKITEGEIELPTYPFSDPDPIPATSARYYPYSFIDGTTDKAIRKRWKTVVLENGKVRVTMFPEIGGKVWGAEDLKTGREFIYFNHAVKFRNISLRGPWCSGGIEFNFGITGHAPSTATPVSYFTRQNPDGSASYFASDTELICGTTWQVEVRLAPNAESFTTHTTWYNGSGFPMPYYHWMTAACSLRGNPRFEYPGKAYIGHNGDSHPWPVDAEGHHLDIYAENNFGFHKSEHVLEGDNSIFGIWWPAQGNVPGFGLVHRNHVSEKYGRKLWLWALSREGAIWEDLLTDTDGQYTELQCGRCFCQPSNVTESPFKNPTFAPGITDTFSEEWGVVRDRAIFEAAHNETNYVSRPQFMPKNFNWKSSYGKYVRGEQCLRQKRDAEGERELTALLEKDPCFAPALDLLASLACRRGCYAQVHQYATRALAINTYDPEANYAEGLAFLAEGEYRKAAERLGIAAFSPLFRSAAEMRIAQIELRAGNWGAARHAAEKALASNALSPEAQVVRIIALRKVGDTEAAARAAEAVLETFPLCHAARRELNLLRPTTQPFTDFVRNELPYETYLALGNFYEECGLTEDAAACYRLAAKDSALGKLRLAALLRDKALLNEALAVPVAGNCPHGREMLPVLAWATETSSHWKARYYRAVLLESLAQHDLATKLLDRCGMESDDAIFYLYRAGQNKGEAALADLLKAESLERSWRTGYRLYRHYADAGNWKAALETTERYVKAYPANKLNIAHATALTQCGRHREAIAFLEKLTVLPSEGGDNAGAPWINAWRALAEEALAKGDRKAATEAVQKALSYPENLGIGRPYQLNFTDSKGGRNPLASWPKSLRALAGDRNVGIR